MIVPVSTTTDNILLSISKLENNLVALMWDGFSNDCTFSDIFTDRYKTEDGIDKDNSIYSYNTINYYVYQPLIASLVLETVVWESVTTNPTSAYSLIEFDTIYNLTDASEFEVFISLDGGETFTQITNQTLYKQVGTKYYFKGLISGLSGTNQIKAKITCSNIIADIKIFAFALGVK